jgi:DNA invertase Pin-like site-specific DNA recombinase
VNLLDLIERIGKAGAAFRFLGDPLWDTSSSQGRLLSTLLAAIAEFERDLIRERTGDGRKRAMAKGIKFGRKPKLSDYQQQEDNPSGVWRKFRLSNKRHGRRDGERKPATALLSARSSSFIAFGG